ncbi:MAG: Lrp/AsnC ligand binding domain-containing protein, partial [Thermoplasmata archaeon]
IGIRISKGKLLEVQKRIAKDKRVYGVYDVTGDWDSIVMARFRNRNELNNFIKKVLSMDFVERTYTQFVLNVVKEERRVLS